MGAGSSAAKKQRNEGAGALLAVNVAATWRARILPETTDPSLPPAPTS